jgi:hypothetical protein
VPPRVPRRGSDRRRRRIRHGSRLQRPHPNDEILTGPHARQHLAVPAERKRIQHALVQRCRDRHGLPGRNSPQIHAGDAGSGQVSAIRAERDGVEVTVLAALTDQCFGRAAGRQLPEGDVIVASTGQIFAIRTEGHAIDLGGGTRERGSCCPLLTVHSVTTFAGPALASVCPSGLNARLPVAVVSAPWIEP